MPRASTHIVRARESKRKQILEAAMPLFVRHGFSRTTISEIAREAGISHGTIFLYFTSKDELFNAALLEPLAEFEQQICIMAQPEWTPVACIRESVKAHIAAFSDPS